MEPVKYRHPGPIRADAGLVWRGTVEIVKEDNDAYGALLLGDGGQGSVRPVICSPLSRVREVR
jgi:hypothetical protein